MQFTREELDVFALTSQQKAAKAQKERFREGKSPPSLSSIVKQNLTISRAVMDSSVQTHNTGKVYSG